MGVTVFSIDYKLDECPGYIVAVLLYMSAVSKHHAKCILVFKMSGHVVTGVKGSLAVIGRGGVEKVFAYLLAVDVGLAVPGVTREEEGRFNSVRI